MVATLMLNNKGPEPVEVKHTLFTLTGERLDVAPVIVAGESFRNIDLRELGAVPGTHFEQGSIRLFHLGPDLVIGAQLYLVDETRSLSFDEKLSEFQNFSSTQLESVWWLPSQESTTTLILSNTSDLEVTTQALVQMGKGRDQEINPTLKPHETLAIVFRQENSGVTRAPRNQVGSASINYSGPKGAVLARTLVEDSSSGYSFSAQFYSPQAGKSSGYQGVGLRLSTATGEKLNPVVVARNVANVPTYLTGRMPYTTADGRDGIVQLPKIKLSPGEAQSLDIQRAITKVAATESISTASVEFDYTTAPGSVLMVAQSVSQDANQVFRVPMWDVPAQRNGTGGYPWFIDGSSSTFVYIKNTTAEKQNYTFSLTYEGGDYSTGVKSIEAHQTVSLDIRAIRDNQVPDERNQTIPLGATHGKIVWSVRGRNSLALLGRSEQADFDKGISSSYACFMCCPNSFRFSSVEPIGFGVTVGGFTTVRGRERDQTCYGSLTPWYYWGETWSVDNSSVISSSGIGDAADVTGVGVGSATVTAHWEVFNFTMEHDLDGPYCVESSDTTEASAPVNVVDVEKIQYQSGSNFVDISGTLYVLKDSSVTFKAIPNPSTETFPTNQPVWSGTSGATSTGPTTTVTFGTISSSTSDFKTVIATAGTNTRTVQVIVYSLTAVLTPQDNFTGRSLTSFGPAEVIALSFTASPSITASQAGGLLWKQTTGSGTLTGASDGTGSYTAAAAPESVTLKLEIQAGPSKTLGPSPTISVIAPSGAYQVQVPGTGIKHVQGTCSAGFQAYTYLTPMTVSFAHIETREGTTTATATGWLSSRNGVTHDAGSWLTVSNCAATTGCREQSTDDIYNQYAQNTGGTVWGVGDFQWNIPQQWRVGTGSASQYTLLLHHFLSDAAGKGTISKGGAGPFSKNANDATSSF